MSNYLQSLFVDSRFRFTGSGTDFTVSLPENVDCGGDCVVSVVAFSAPVTYWTVEIGLRDQLLLWFTLPTQSVQ